MVHLDERLKEKIEEIKRDVDCPRDHACLEMDPEELCKAEDFGLEGYADCLDEKGPECDFSLPFGRSRLCRCPLRVYLAKHLSI